MQTVNIHEAKTHLSKLVDQASAGEAFIIAKAGKPLVKVIPLRKPAADQAKQIGFFAGQLRAPKDLDELGRRQIEQLFDGR